MPNLPAISAMDLAALLCSRVCHDVISPVGAIANGLELLDEGGDLNDAYEVDQSPFAHLDTFRELAKRNAGMVFQAMQFE